MTDNILNENNDATTDDTGNNDTINDHAASKSIWSKFKYLIIWALIIIILYGAFWAAVFYLESDWTIRGQFGDMFGAINALFSGIALAGIIFAIYLQSQELAAQREELRLTREEMKLSRGEMERSREELKGQKEVMSTQIELIKMQQWENTFFKMIDMHRKNVEHFSYGGVKGSLAFIEVARELKNKLLPEGDPGDKYGKFEHPGFERRILDKKSYKTLIIQYINSTTAILEYTLDLKDKSIQSKYHKIFKSQISKGEEAVLLLYRDYFKDMIVFQKVMDETQFLDLFST